jgi:hypothetical protein
MTRPGSTRPQQPHYALFIRIFLLGVAVFGLLLQSANARAEETVSPETQKTELFTAAYDLTWDKLLVTLKSFDLSVASADKDSGKVSTTPHRYFRISSAKFPPVQEDYRDTYEVQVTKRPENKTQVQITRKFELYDRTRPPSGEWVVQQDVKEKTGTSISEILSALALELAAAGLPAAR